MKTIKHISVVTLISAFILIIMAAVGSGCGSKSRVAEMSFNPEKIREEIRLLTDSVSKDNYIGTAQMGRLPITAPAYLRRHALMGKAYDAELKNLSLHPNTVVSLVAFEGLYERGDEMVPEIFNRIAERSDMLHYIRGDISTQIPMLEYAYVYVMRFPMPGEAIPLQLEPGTPRYQLPEKTHAEVTQKIAALRQDQ